MTIVMDMRNSVIIFNIATDLKSIHYLLHKHKLKNKRTIQQYGLYFHYIAKKRITTHYLWLPSEISIFKYHIHQFP